MSKRKIALTAILVVSLVGVLGALSGTPAHFWKETTSGTVEPIGAVDVVKTLSTTECPATCVVGSICMDSNAGAAAMLLVCETANSWVAQGTGAGGDDILIDGGAVVNPNFDPGGDIIFVDTANTVTANVQANSVALGTDTTGGYANSATEAGSASSGDSATAFFSSGEIANAQVADDLTLAGGIIGTTAITLVQGAAPTPTGEGVIEWESDDRHIIIGDSVDQVEFVPTEDVSGDITMTTAGAVTISASVIGNTEMADDAIGAAEMADGDHGAISWSGGVATVEDLVCTNCVTGTEIATGQVGANQLSSNSVQKSELDDTVCLSIISGSGNPSEPDAIPDFIGFFGFAYAGGMNTNEGAMDTFLMAGGGGFVNSLYCSVNVAPGAGNDDWKMTVKVGAVGSLSTTAVTCNIDETDTDCFDTTNSAAIAQGESITVLIDSSGGGADPDTAAFLTCALCIGQ